MPRAPLPTKPCARCGRTITWRKAWARDWASVRWCSDSCRKHGLTEVDLRLQDIDPDHAKGPIRVRRPR